MTVFLSVFSSEEAQDFNKKFSSNELLSKKQIDKMVFSFVDLNAKKLFLRFAAFLTEFK